MLLLQNNLICYRAATAAVLMLCKEVTRYQTLMACCRFDQHTFSDAACSLQTDFSLGNSLMDVPMKSTALAS